MSDIFENKFISVFALILGLAVISLTGGCREQEQGRVLQYQKGVYLGKVDKPTDAATRAALRGRAWSQSALAAGNVPSGAGGASGSSASSVPSTRIQGQRAITVR